jgi:transcriptional regulator with XRE-family HTH domain
METTMKLSSGQLRAARALINMTQDQLAERSGVAIDAIRRFESGYTKKLQEKSESALIHALQDRIEFLDNEGLRLQPIGVEIFQGPERFEEFYTFLYDHLDRFGGDVCLSVANEKLFQDLRDPACFEKHRQRMWDLHNSGKMRFRVLTAESRYFGKDTYVEYRYESQQSTSPTAFYAFGNCLALVSFDHNPAPYVVLHKAGPFAEAYRTAFEIAWKNGRRPPKEKEEEA